MIDEGKAARLRRAEGYTPQFDIDLAYGAQAEMFVMDVIEALSKGDIEVKHDDGWVKSGNLYVEYEQRRHSGLWVKSGIATSEASLWCFVLADTQTMIVVPRESLKEIVRHLATKKARGYGRNPFRREEKDGSNPTRGIIVPVCGPDGLFEYQRLEAAKRRPR